MTQSKYLDMHQAAAYLDIDATFLRQALYRKAGPAFTAITPRKKVFTIEDLDAWKATWQRVEQRAEKNPPA